ncbi:MAG: TolC family protein [Spirochaetes bacterium]|nr:TolC family protein [Spirochaetota bacterium]
MNRELFLMAFIMLLLPAAVSPARAAEPLTWEECVAYAMANNPELRSSQELIRQGRADVGIARSAYLPRISASLGLDASRRESTSELERLKLSRMKSIGEIESAIRNDLTSTGSVNRTEALSYGIRGTQMIFDSMKTIYDIKSASSLAESARYDHALTSSRVRLELRTAFVDLLKAQERIIILKEIAERSRKNLDLVKMRFRAGREHRGSLLNAEASLANARNDLVQAERTIAVARRSLLKQMGISRMMEIRAEGALASAPADEKKPDLDEVAAVHPGVLQAKSRSESARYGENAKIAGFLPVISATASAERSKSHDDGVNAVNRTSGMNYSAGIQATMPLFTGGNTYYNLDRAKSQTRKLKNDEIDVRHRVILALEQTWNDWQNAIGNVDVQRKFLDAAEERARIAEAQYSLGLMTFDNWIIIENDLSQKKKSHLEALAERSVAEARWIQAGGGTLAYDK